MEKKKPVTSKANMASQRKMARKGQDTRPMSRRWRQMMGERMPLKNIDKRVPEERELDAHNCIRCQHDGGAHGLAHGRVHLTDQHADQQRVHHSVAHPESRRAIRRARMVFSFFSFESPMSALA
jgi:hypothetical protein